MTRNWISDLSLKNVALLIVLEGFLKPNGISDNSSGDSCLTLDAFDSS